MAYLLKQRSKLHQNQKLAAY